MAAVGPEMMVLLFVIGWAISSGTTLILFSAVAESRSQPDLVMSISSRLLSGSSPLHGLVSPQALGTGPDPHALLPSPAPGALMERKRSTSFYDYKDRKSREGARAARSTPLLGPSYGDLLAMVLPPKFMSLLDLVLLVHQQLALTVYFLFISEFLAKLPYLSDVPPDFTILVLSVPATKLAQLESIGKLARFGVCYRWLHPDAHMARPDFSLEPDLRTTPAVILGINSGLERILPLSHAAKESGSRRELASSKDVFSYMWHTNCVTVARELRDPSQFRCCLVVFTSTTVLLVAYTSLAYFGYETFGQKLRSVPTIMMLYSPSDPLFMAVRFFLSISLFVAIPLNVYPVRESVLSLIKHNCSKQAHDRSVEYQGLLSVVLVMVPAFCAICFPYVTQIITVIGGTLVSFLMIVFPIFIGELVLPMAWVRVFQLLTLAFVPQLIAASLGWYGKPI